MIQFKSLTLRNFLSFGNVPTTINFDVGQSIFLGTSGSGKSAVLDGITFALYNKAFRDINKAQLINNINKRETVVVVVFSKNNEDYKIIRGISPDFLEIYKDNKKIQLQERSVEQKLLEDNILQINYKTFILSVVIGATNYTPFLRLTTKDRRAFIERVLQIEHITNIADRAKEKAKIVRDELRTDTNSFELKTNTRTEIHYNLEQLRQLKKSQDEINRTLKETTKKTLETKKNFELELKSKIDSITDKNRTSARNVLKTISEQYETKINLVSSKLDIISKELSTLNEKKNSINLNIRSQERVIQEQEKNFNNLEHKKNCPCCNQILSPQALYFLNSNIEHSTNHLSELKNPLIDILKEIELVEKEKKEITNKINDIKEEFTKTKENHIKQSKLEHIQSISELSDKLTQVQKEIYSLETELSKIKPTLELDSKITESQQKLYQIEEDLNLLKGKVDKNKTSLKLYETIVSLMSDSGIKSSIVEYYIKTINSYINEYLQKIGFYIKVTLDKEFNDKIIISGNQVSCYNSLSEGEKQRLDLCILFAWRKIAESKSTINTNLLIIDEVFDSYLDLETTETVLSLFKLPEFETLSTIVISHKPEIAQHFKSVINFSLKNGFSRCHRTV